MAACAGTTADENEAIFRTDGGDHEVGAVGRPALVSGTLDPQPLAFDLDQAPAGGVHDLQAPCVNVHQRYGAARERRRSEKEPHERPHQVSGALVAGLVSSSHHARMWWGDWAWERVASAVKVAAVTADDSMGPTTQ
jgi:hypothetical protein